MLELVTWAWQDVNSEQETELLRGMQQAQCIQVVGTYPLAQEGVDIRQTCPLPAGGTGEDQGQAAALSVAEVTLFPQQTLVLRRQPDKTQRQRDDVQWLMYMLCIVTQLTSPTLAVLLKYAEFQKCVSEWMRVRERERCSRVRPR